MRRFGLGISRLEAPGVEAMNDALTDLEFVMNKVFDQAITKLAPVVLSFLESSLGELEKLNTTLDGQPGYWEAIADGAMFAGAMIVNSMSNANAHLRMVANELAAMVEGCDALQKFKMLDFAGGREAADRMHILMGEAATAAGDVLNANLSLPGIEFIRAPILTPLSRCFAWIGEG